MNRDETKVILMGLEAIYPHYHIPDESLSITIDMWSSILADYPYKDVSLAVKCYASSDTSGYVPTPGKLIAIMDKPNMMADLTEQEASALVMKAVKRSTYYSEEEFAKLPPAVQRAVGSASQLKMWAMDEDFNPGVISSNIERSYRAVLQSERELRRMPTEMRNLIEQTTEQITNRLEMKNE